MCVYTTTFIHYSNQYLLMLLINNSDVQTKTIYDLNNAVVFINLASLHLLYADIRGEVGTREA